MNSAIAHPYGIHSLEHKVQNKVLLQEELGWPAEPKRPMVCLPTGISDKLGGELLKEILPGLLSLPIELVILGKGSASYGSYLTQVAKEHPHRIAIISNDERSVHKMFAAADMALFLADPTTMSELQTALHYAAIPVCPATKVISSYDPNQEHGEAFFYEKPTVWHSFAAIVRALETFRFPFDWRTIQKHCMEKIGA
jgi:starch synthase